MKRKYLWIVVPLAVVIVVFALNATGAIQLVKPHQTVYSTGHRQEEYKILGVIPYEVQVNDPSVVVKPDVEKAFREGFPLSPEVDWGHATNHTIISRKPGMQYHLEAPFKGDVRKFLSRLAVQIKDLFPHHIGAMDDWDAYGTTASGDRISFVIETLHPAKATGVQSGQIRADITRP